MESVTAYARSTKEDPIKAVVVGVVDEGSGGGTEAVLLIRQGRHLGAGVLDWDGECSPATLGALNQLFEIVMNDLNGLARGTATPIVVEGSEGAIAGLKNLATEGIGAIRKAVRAVVGVCKPRRDPR